MPENVQPINYCIKWSKILFNIAHVKHYVLLLMIWDFDLEFSIFVKFIYFRAFRLASIKKIISFTFLRYFNLKVEYKEVLSIFRFWLVWSWSIPYLTILYLLPPFSKFPDLPLALFLKRNHLKKYQVNVFLKEISSYKLVYVNSVSFNYKRLKKKTCLFWVVS